MNKVYRSVWNATTNTWAAAAETAKSRSKGSARAARRAVVALALGGASMGGAFAAEVCTTEDGRKGSLSSAGVCTPASTTGTTNTMSTGSIGTMAALDDTYIKVNNGNVGTAATVGSGAIAMGAAAKGDGANSTALGYQASSLADRSIAVGSGATVDTAAQYGVAIGRLASVSDTGTNSVALGQASVADRENTVSVGSAAQQRQITNVAAGTQANDAVNFAQLSTKTDDTYIKVNGTGTAAAATGGGAIAIGENAQANSTGSAYASVSIGRSSEAGLNSTAVGGSATAASRGAAFGGSATASANGATAIGYRSSASAENATALGFGSVSNRAGAVSVGSDDATAPRGAFTSQIVNMAAGTQANDAVNVSQLKPVVDALGGNATINPDGSVTGPTYTLKNGSGLPQATVGGALNELDTSLTATNTNVTNLTGRVSTAETNITTLQQQVGSGSIGLVQQASAGADLTVGKDTNGAAVNFAGTAGNRKLTGVADGAVTTVSKEAINGSQLRGVSDSVASAIGAGSTVNPDGSITAPSFTVGDGNGGTKIVNNVGAAVENLNDRVTVNEGDITTLQQQVGSGTIGLVQQAGAGANLTVGKDTDGAAVDFTGKAGARKLTGVADGAVTTVSKEAINGSQLRGVSDSVAAAIGAGSTVNPDGSITAPSFTVGDGNGGTTIVRNVGAAVENLNDRVTVNEGDITNIRNDLSNGSVGLVQQAGAGAELTVGKSTDGAIVNFAGTAGDRRLTGVANGTADNDAASIAQLKAMGLFDPNNNLPLAAVVYDGIDLKNVTFGGTGGTYLNNVAPGLIGAGSMQAVNGSQLFALDQKLENYYSNLDGRVGVIEQGAGNGGGSGGGTGLPPDFSGSGTGSTQIGAGADASGSNSSAIGNGAVASGSNSSAIGQGSSASGNGGTAIGQGSNASANNSVALGNGSVADREGTVSVGSAGAERQITNVAAGTAPTDAVNVQQMNNTVHSARQDAMGGVAAAMAVAGLPQSSMPGRTFMAISGSTYGNEYGTAIGASYMTKDGKWTVKGAVNTSSRGEVGAVVGGGFYW